MTPVRSTGRQPEQRVSGSRNIVNKCLPPFARKLSAMIASGMPIVSSIKSLENQEHNRSFKTVLNSVGKGLENGSSFSECLMSFPPIFDRLFTGLVMSGEKSGHLAECLASVAENLEARASLHRKVRSAMMYPMIILSLALVVAGGMTAFVLPVFAELFTDLSGTLPMPTRILLNVSQSIREFGLPILLCIAILVTGIKMWTTTPNGAYAFDSMLLHLPVFGSLNRKLAAARFARTYALLLRSGVPILSAIDISADASSNLATARLVAGGRTVVERGEPLSRYLLQQKVFPEMLTDMLLSGEKSGKVDEMLDNVASFFEEESATTLDGLTAILNPLLMIIIGLIIGAIVIAMFLPIMKLPSLF
jgi:type IV pilus assembly protein PilC